MGDIMKVLDYRKRIKTLKDEGNELLSRSEEESREMNEEERNSFDQINAEIDRVEARMDEYIRLNRISDEELREHTAQRPEPKEAAVDTPGPFRSFGEQLMAVVDFYTGKRQDERLFQVRAASGLNESNPAEGGFLVQQDFNAELLTPMWETNEIPNRCRRIPVSAPSNSFSMNTIDESSRATGSRWGGIRVYRRAEAGTVTKSKPKFGRIEMKLESMMGICYATEENLQDSAQLGAIVKEGFRDEFGFKISDEVIRGTGAGQCLGILNSNALVTVPKETGQEADTVITENILNMWKSRRGRNFVWLYNQELEDQLETLTLAIGTGGVEKKLFVDTPNGPTIKGAPARAVEVASGPGDVGDIVLADLNQYLLIDKGGIQEAESIHVQFLYGEMTFRFMYRINGQPMLKSKITPYKRTSTDFYISPFVTLAAR